VSEDTAYAHLYATFHDVIRTLGSDVKSVAEGSICQVDSHRKRFRLSDIRPHACSPGYTSLLYSDFGDDIEEMERLAVERDYLIDVWENLHDTILETYILLVQFLVGSTLFLLEIYVTNQITVKSSVHG
jgi:hypothetical protein